jgi:hypothetical protein
MSPQDYSCSEHHLAPLHHFLYKSYHSLSSLLPRKQCDPLKHLHFSTTSKCQNSEADENEKFMWITTQILNLTFYNLDCGVHVIPFLYLFFGIIETCLKMEAIVFY